MDGICNSLSQSSHSEYHTSMHFLLLLLSNSCLPVTQKQHIILEPIFQKGFGCIHYC